MLFGREESFWNTDGDTAERKRGGREVSGKCLLEKQSTAHKQEMFREKKACTNFKQAVRNISSLLHFLRLSNFTLFLILESNA